MEREKMIRMAAEATLLKIPQIDYTTYYDFESHHHCPSSTRRLNQSQNGISVHLSCFSFLCLSLKSVSNYLSVHIVIVAVPFHPQSPPPHTNKRTRIPLGVDDGNVAEVVNEEE